MSKQLLWSFCVVAAAGGATLSGCQATTWGSPIYDGAALYQGHCASCHGATGAGDGPVAKRLVSAPPDLRRDGLSKLELMEIIDGRGLRTAHGTLEMPVWGWAFRSYEQSEAEVQARLEVLANHVISLRVP